MELYITEQGYNIELGNDKLIVISQPFGEKANTSFNNEELMVQVKPSLMYFISPRFNIKKNGKVIGQIVQKYFGGNFKIQFEYSGGQKDYLLKTSRKKFELVDDLKNSLINVKSDFSWKKLDHEFEAVASNSFSQRSYYMELAFYTMFCIYFYSSQNDRTTAS